MITVAGGIILALLFLVLAPLTMAYMGAAFHDVVEGIFKPTLKFLWKWATPIFLLAQVDSSFRDFYNFRLDAGVGGIFFGLLWIVFWAYLTYRFIKIVTFENKFNLNINKDAEGATTEDIEQQVEHISSTDLEGAKAHLRATARDRIAGDVFFQGVCVDKVINYEYVTADDERSKWDFHQYMCETSGSTQGRKISVLWALEENIDLRDEFFGALEYPYATVRDLQTAVDRARTEAEFMEQNSDLIKYFDGVYPTNPAWQKNEAEVRRRSAEALRKETIRAKLKNTSPNKAK